MAFPRIHGNGIGSSLIGKLLYRESDSGSQFRNVRPLYGDHSWISDLDIVNELAGHQGCVNALSWSKSGRLLASGSDDTNLLIHKYQPEETSKPFSLATCLSTGHRDNIFSIKFMPHSNDNVLISCAGDHEVRVFDLEHSGRSTETSASSSMAGVRSQAGRQSIASLYQNVTYLSDGNTNARVYRSHSDRVKRIVTESSPYLFLTCSEDGEVRQFDLRLPSSAYPRQGASRGFEHSAGIRAISDAPPPLISYKRYQLDLNSISCSASQPHYIVLGGAHLHCFLHDRRMLGRDPLHERGSRTDSDMGTATRCVRRFAPQGQSNMRAHDSGHVTACKISDRNPNEMIASWSGDNIYAFNLVQPDETAPVQQNVIRKLTESNDRKRKPSTQGSREEDVVIRMHYENGQTEDIPVAQSVSRRVIDQARESVLTDAQKRSAQIAKSLVRIRRLLFSMSHGSDLISLKPTLSEILGLSSSCIQEMDEVMREWRYPVNPAAEDITFQNTLRKNRDSARRFLQACGTLARALGGELNTAGHSPLLGQFAMVGKSELEHRNKDHGELFRYDFMKAVLLWLEGGREKLSRDFALNGRQTASQDAIGSSGMIDEDEILRISLFLKSQAEVYGERQIINVDHSRFETDERLIVFMSEESALIAFLEAIKIPFGAPKSSTTSHEAQNNELAMKFWGLKVCRGILMNAGEHVNFAFVDRAFGGLGVPPSTKERSQEDVRPGNIPSSVQATTSAASRISDDEADEMDQYEGGIVDIDDVLEDIDSIGEEEDTVDTEDDEGDDADDMEEDDEDYRYMDENEDEQEDVLDSSIIFRSTRAHGGTLRAQVNRDIPCNANIRMYRGHCNVKTVKDVNYFGLDDEYVVSGCDSGHLFIWDAKTSKLLNILKGDEEVVNVVQGHPYEPTLAVSGIDHTIKIFSPDQRAQHDARKGRNLGIPPNAISGTSSLRYGHRARQSAAASTAAQPPPSRPETEDLPSPSSSDIEESNSNGLPSRRRMHASYTIMNQNDVDRAGGNREAFITRDLLSQLALMMARRRQRQHHRAAGNAGNDNDNDGEGAGNGDDDDDEEEEEMDSEAEAVGAALEDRCANM